MGFVTRRVCWLSLAGVWRSTRSGSLCAAFALSCAVVLLSATEGYAARSAALVVDANTGRVLYEDDADAERYPASLTKVMTLYLVFEALRARRISMSTQITISSHAASQPPSNLDLDTGDKLRVADAIRALVTKSANDVAAAIAEHLAGSEEKFAALMTRRARAIGMSRTTFRNASGLPDSEQVTTARDMVTLGMRIQDDFPEEYKLFQTQYFTYGRRRYSNHNTLLRTYEGIDGIKTGYTRASGFNLLSSARKGGRHIVAAVFGGATSGLRNQRMRFLIAKNMRSASTRRTRAVQPQLIAQPRPVRRPTRVAVAQNSPQPVASYAAVASSSTNSNYKSDPRRRLKRHMNRAALSRLAHRAATTPETSDETLENNAPATNISIARVRVESIVPRPIPAVAVASPRPTIVGTRHDTSPMRMAFSAPSMAQSIRPPSTLQAQAAALNSDQSSHMSTPMLAVSNTQMTNRSSLGGPRPGTVAIQIGAYNSVAEAERALQATKERAAGLLNHANAFAIPAGGAKPIVRARFGGFDAATASSTCLELRRRSIDCFVAR